VNDELEAMRKETVLDYFKILSQPLPWRTKENFKKRQLGDGVLAENQTRDVPKTSLVH
jgi:hypothetical protein